MAARLVLNISGSYSPQIACCVIVSMHILQTRITYVCVLLRVAIFYHAHTTCMRMCSPFNPDENAFPEIYTRQTVKCRLLFTRPPDSFAGGTRYIIG